MKFLKDRLKDRHVSEAAKFALIKKIVGGLCCQCEGIPPKLSVMMWVIAQLIEKYCEKCFKKWKQREH